MPGREELNAWFAPHQLDEAGTTAVEAIRAAGLKLASAIVRHSPGGADQAHALCLVRQAVMLANNAVALGGK